MVDTEDLSEVLSPPSLPSWFVQIDNNQHTSNHCYEEVCSNKIVLNSVGSLIL